MKRSALALLVLGATLFATACSQSEAASGTTRSAAAPTGTLPRLVFFMNPRGQPCMMQDSIMHEMSGELSGKVDVVYYKTNESDDLAKFQEFGIRSLPSLVLTDATGREVRRAPPGIRSADEIRQLVAR
jgi:thioredoxin 1